MKKFIFSILFVCFTLVIFLNLAGSEPEKWSHLTDTWTYEGVTFPKMSEGNHVGYSKLDSGTIYKVYKRKSDGMIFAYGYIQYPGWKTLKARMASGKPDNYWLDLNKDGKIDFNKENFFDSGYDGKINYRFGEMMDMEGEELDALIEKNEREGKASGIYPSIQSE